ncbi:MAG: hypothetical protein VXA40_02575 [Gammaproteobacteria bacterium]
MGDEFPDIGILQVDFPGFVIGSETGAAAEEYYSQQMPEQAWCVARYHVLRVLMLSFQ